MAPEEAGNQTGAQAPLTSTPHDVEMEKLLWQNLDRQRALRERLRGSKEGILKVQEDIKIGDAMGWSLPRVDVDVEMFLREREVEALKNDWERVEDDVEVRKLLRQNRERQRILRERLRRSKGGILNIQEDIGKGETMGWRGQKVDVDVDRLLREREAEVLKKHGEREEDDAEIEEWLRQIRERQRVWRELLRRSKEGILKVQEDIKKGEAIGRSWPKLDIDVEKFLREREVEALEEDGERVEGEKFRDGERVGVDGEGRR